jgi:transcriptional regulator with XRE-family HTH domain
VRRKNIIGLNIRKTRKNIHVTQMELAGQLQLLGIRVDRATIAKIELGLRPLSDIEIIAIAKILKTNVNLLFSESEAQFNTWIEHPEK